MRNVCWRKLSENDVCLYLSGVTALHLAVQRGNIDAVRCLLSAGADLDVLDSKYGHTALFYAIQRNDVTTSDLLSGCGSHRARVTMYPGSSAAVAQPTKCSADLLQPVINHRSLPPTCCLTGSYTAHTRMCTWFVLHRPTLSKGLEG